ncbi:MAG: TlpA family protein disulfide reductase [Chitinophagaceae bacterium]|nr:TlpA family protein disulfide reductase [Chitinophagaceae bacterium]
MLFFLAINKHKTVIAFFILALPLFLFSLYALLANPSLFPLYIPANPLVGLAGIITSVLIKVKSKKIALLFGGSTFLVLLLYCFWALPLFIQAKEKRSLKVLEQTPINFTNSLIKLDKTHITPQILSQKKVVLLDFWFIGCEPCMRKMKYLQKIYDLYKDNSEVLIAVVSYGESDKIDEVLEFKQKNPEYRFDFFYDANGAFCKANNFKTYPIELILNSSQKVLSTYHGFGRETEHLYIDKTKQIIDEIIKKSKVSQ